MASRSASSCENRPHEPPTIRLRPCRLGLRRVGFARVNAARLREHIEALSVYGRPAGGTFADGVSRVAYSDADVAGRRYVMGLMEQAGLKPRIDAAGNIFARREGAATIVPVLFGSHIDSVPSGGNFDGDLGSLAAIEVVQTLNEAGITTRSPLEIVVLANEEGAAYNSGLDGGSATAGQVKPEDLNKVWNGVKKADAIRKIGGNPDRIAEARLKSGAYRCYLELQIERGGRLEQEGIPVGVVQGIVAIDRYEVEIKGFANHAGTTPMPQRQDALLAASYLTVAVNEIVRGEPGGQVGTVGQIAVSPNVPNIVPGSVQLTVEFARPLVAFARGPEKLPCRQRRRLRSHGRRTTMGHHVRWLPRVESRKEHQFHHFGVPGKLSGKLL